MKNKRILSLVLALAMLLGTFSFAFADKVVIPTEEDYKEANVTDIKGNDYETAFAKLMSVGVAQGKGEKGADLDANLTRAEAAKMVLHMLGLQEGIVNYGPSGNKFKDVTNKHWASQYIAVAADHGIVTGHTDGTFRPEDAVTEDQIVAMIVRALEWGPIVGGNYPYGEYAKALELGIINKAPIYNKVATRGYAFDVAANSLTAEMAQRSATEDKLTYHGEGYRNLLNHRLQVGSMNSAVVVKTARMERDYKASQLQVETLAGRPEELIYKGEGFDATTILGDFVNIWYKYNEKTRDNEIVYIEKDANFKKEVGIVEEYKSNELKLENGRTYNLKDAIVYKDNVKDAALNKDDYVTITVDKNNKVRFVDAFDIEVNNSTTTLDLVSKVVKAEDGRFEFFNQQGVKRTISDEKLIVYKNGELAEVEDIKEFDLVKSVPMAGQARTTFVLVVGEKLEGKLNDVEIDVTRSDDKIVRVKLDEDTLLVDKNNFMVLGDDYKEAVIKDNYVDVSNTLKDYIDEDIALITVAGKVKVLVGKAEPKTVKSGLVLNAGLQYKTFEAKDIAALRLLNQDGENEEITFTATDKEIYSYNKIRADHQKDITNKLDGYKVYYNDRNTVSVFYGPQFVKSNKVVSTAVHNIERNRNGENVEKFEGLDKYVLKTAKNYYDVTDATVFYVLDKDGDYTVQSYKELKDSKPIDAVYMYVIKDADTAGYKTPTADVVVVVEGRFDIEKELNYGIVNKIFLNGTVYEVFNGEETVRYAVSKHSEKAMENQAISFYFTGKKSGDYDEITIEEVGPAGKLEKIDNNGLYVIKEIGSDQSTYFRVSSDGLIVQNDRLYDSNRGNLVYYLDDGYGKLRVLNFYKVWDGRLPGDGVLDRSGVVERVKSYRGDIYVIIDGVEYLYDGPETDVNKLQQYVGVAVDFELGYSRYYKETAIMDMVGKDASLSEINVDGVALEGFKPGKFEYEYEVPFASTTVPTVTATATHNGTDYKVKSVVVTPATAVPGTTEIKVTAEDGITELTYKVKFVHADPSDEVAVANAKAALAIGGNIDANNDVTGDIVLPKTGLHGTTITWAETTTATNIIDTNTGKVELPDNDTTVKLTATIKKGDAEETKEFTLTVKAKVLTAAEKAEADADALSVAWDGNKLTGLATNGTNGSTITWTVATESNSTLNNDGTFSIDPEDYATNDGEGNVVTNTITFTLTTTVANDGAVENRTYTVTVVVGTDTNLGEIASVTVK